MLTLFALLTGILIHTQAVINNSEELIFGSNVFGYDLSNELYTNSSINIWISPFCITSCFSLIYPGSAGNTQTEIANVLGFPTSTSNPGDITQEFFSLQGLIDSTYTGQGTKSSIIGIANKIYASKTLTLKQSYITSLYNTIRNESFIDPDFDFTSENATTIINNWVDTNTNGLIDSIIDENTDISNWVLLALNAIYLNGSFASQFEPEMTSLQNFYTDITRNTILTDIHLMHQQNHFMYYEDNKYQWLKFNFSDDSADLFILYALPKLSGGEMNIDRPGLYTDNDYINNVINNLESKYIALALPKLSIFATYKSTLKTALKDLGIIDAFGANTADFSGIADATQLYIDAVIHKTMVKMDEKGLVAAAVTAIGLERTSVLIDTKPILFKADHPFQMYIIDGEHDNTILFMGQINNPGIPEGSETPTYVETINPWNNFTVTCENIICDDEEEFCIFDDLSGTQCTSCAAISCESGQECIDGIGCKFVISCSDISCDSADKPYCIYDDINGPRCVEVCKCDIDDDCQDGFKCLGTPTGFEGCDPNVAGSCFRFCSKKGETCGGIVGTALCVDPEICITSPIGGLGTNTQPVGDCYSLQETC